MKHYLHYTKPHWTDSFRTTIYQQNLRQLQQQTASQGSQRKVLKQMTEITILNTDTYIPIKENSPLPQFITHSDTQFFLPLQHQIYTKSDFEALLPRYKGKAFKKQIEQDVLRLLDMSENEKQIEIMWQIILQKYICPLDLLAKIEIYFQFLKWGTEMMDTFLFVFCQNISPAIFLDSILSVSIYTNKMNEFRSQKGQLQVKKFLRDHFCHYCQIYCCIRHQSLESSTNESKQTPQCCYYQQPTEDNHALSYFSLASEICELISSKFESQHKQHCSSLCFRCLNKKKFLQQYSAFQLPNIELAEQIEMCRQMLGYKPCLIASLLKMNCIDVALYFILSANPKRLAATFGLPQQKYLKNKAKLKFKTSNHGCLCSEGQCSADQCLCFAQKRQCSPLSCPKCFYPSPNQQSICLNKEVATRQKPRLKIGRSIEIQSSLGLFTLDFIPKETLVLWTSGQILSQHENELKKYLQAWKPRRDSYQIGHHFLNNSRLGSKDRFAISMNSEASNLYAVQKQVAGQIYSYLYASRDIECYEELKLALH